MIYFQVLFLVPGSLFMVRGLRAPTLRVRGFDPPDLNLRVHRERRKARVKGLGFRVQSSAFSSKSIENVFNDL